MSESTDNHTERLQKLEKIIKSLHRGASPALVKEQLKEIVRHTEATEIAAMEQRLIDGGMPVEEVRSMCDLHAQVLKEILSAAPASEVAPGHPVDTFHRENEALQRTIKQIESLLDEIRRQTEAGPQWQKTVLDLRQCFNELTDIEKHYQRKENLLFSRLERLGVSGPAKVMWSKDDEIRGLLKRARRILSQDSLTFDELQNLIITTIEPALEAAAGMIYKEENILLPMALGTLTDEDWAAIWRDSPIYGWCLVEPREGYQPAAPAAPATASSEERALQFPSGSLTPEQLHALLNTLPLELTFVDADDCVRYFSESPQQIFKRTKAILGRKVQNCHPPASVHVVQKILDDFRGGQRDLAEFWLNIQDKFVYIRYFAVRDAAGKYLGTLEMTQDLTRLRTLQGQRRLLQYD